MLIDVYGLLPWSRTAAYQPRANLKPETNSFFGRQIFTILFLILVFPVMVNSIEPVPSSNWSLSVDPSYIPAASTSKKNEDGSGYVEDERTTTTFRPGYFSWQAGRKSLRKNITSIDPLPKRRVNRVGSGDSDEPRRRFDAEDEDEDFEIDEKFLTAPPPAAAVVRWYRLYNRCSGGYLQMYMSDVNAKGKYASPFVQLRVETDSYGSRIRIQSQKFNKYLCFNRRQRITGKYKGRSERCVFVEKISDNHYTELESAWRPGLYLGFNRGDGKFLDPARYYTDRRTCFQFIKNSNLSYVDEFNQQRSPQNDQGPTDFTRFSPENHRWLRTRMRQDVDAGELEEGDFERGKKFRQHRLRHRHHHRHRHPDQFDDGQ